jgi:hypothetical protein
MGRCMGEKKCPLAFQQASITPLSKYLILSGLSPFACQMQLRDMCSTRPIWTLRPGHLHPNVFGTCVSLGVGGYLISSICPDSSHVVLARAGGSCAFYRRVNERYNLFFYLLISEVQVGHRQRVGGGAAGCQRG